MRSEHKTSTLSEIYNLIIEKTGESLKNYYYFLHLIDG